ncbi:Aspartic proteinase nepenthesin-2 [Vitis vinifera]|uniref:Aspartic proteinase nepenthesin-2 n=1 Tax=Vitis vinifera TaxID=29760 RepID=A0A438BY21_VITVI|nr:Aspartic proteinase nepenthesin-2 [Vitis vinifera]
MASVNLLLIICFTFIFSPCISAASDSKGFSTNLIHIHSPSSPYKNVKAESLAKDTALESTLSRHAYLRARQQKALQPADFVPPPLIRDKSAFLANLSIGNPPTNVYVVLDTGSDLFWIQCEPCDVCYKQKDPIYNRTKSDSYTEMLCNEPPCLSLGREGQCSDSGSCLYQTSYADGTRTSGLLSYEKVAFTSHYSDEDKTAQVGFGCGLQNLISSRRAVTAGVLGLGPGQVSLVSQLSAIAEFYYVNLLGIGLGVEEPRLDINSSSFERKPDGSGGVIIDSGSTLSIFPPEVYEVVRNAVVDKLKKGYNISPLTSSPDCFEGKIERDLKFFPTMVLYLESTGILNDRWSIFLQRYDELFCLGFTSGEGLSIIGTLAQQSYKFGYNLELSTLSIESNPDCGL